MKKCGCGEKFSCGCCEGIEILTPQATANRPGLSALRYRVGTHSAFFETMLARLSNSYLETAEIDAAGNQTGSKIYPLKNLNTRASDDPSIALLDASAIMLDVLTFYQERIVNEGYLKTANERRSILELARLVGYTLRPGVAASVFLAYTMDDNSEPVEIPIGARAQSIPAPVKSAADAPAQSAPPPAELPQSFETSEKIEARKEWNDLKPRAARPQNITSVNAGFVSAIYFEGTETNLKPNDPLLFVFEDQGEPVFRKVKTVEPLFDDKKTKVTLQYSLNSAASENAILQVIDRYQNNFTAFCIDAQDRLLNRGLDLLKAVKTAIVTNNPSTQPVIFNSSVSTQPFQEALLKELIELKSDIDKSGNMPVQKWFVSLLNELLEIMRALGVFDRVFAVFRRQPNFEPLLSFLKNIKNLAGLLKILRELNGFDELMDKALAIVRRLKGFDESKLNEIIGTANTTTKGNFSRSAFSSLINLTAPLSLPPSRQPANSLLLGRKATEVFDAKKDTLPQILTAFNKDIGTNVYQAWANTTVTKPLSVKIYALRVIASLFGNSVPPRFKRDRLGNVTETKEPSIVEDIRQVLVNHENDDTIYLDASYDKILPDSWVVVDKRAVDTTGFKNFDLLNNAPENLVITRAANVAPSVSRSDYDFSGKTTRIDLKDSWIKFKSPLERSPDEEFRLIRQTVVHAQSEQLALADEPITYDVCGDRIELGLLYDGLRAGRWIIVSGERTDIPNTTGVKASELVMLSGVEQTYDEDLPGDTIHSTLILAKKLAYTYKRDTVKIYGNIVKATHGETRSEVLGSGDASQAMQAFTLKQPPLTYVSAPTTSGIKNTLVVRVNDVEWKEADSLAELNPQDRNFVTKTDDEAKTTVIFGNGEQGGRLPTGIENVKAVYRNGIGKPGNVKAEQISLLMTKPLGVREVINPLRASGGADKETGDQARRNVPIALMALDRLVSTGDYADFARTFAGIGKASAVRLSDGRRQIVHLTIAGADDIPIDVNSDLFNNLRRALAKYGDSFVPVKVVQRELIALVIAANVHILPDYLWESVEPKIRASLRYIFSFERRELGQSIFLSEVISAIQRIEGVLYVDVDIFDGISETEIKNEESLENKKSGWTNPNKIAGDLKKHVSAKPARFDKDSKKLVPAQLAYLMPDVPDTLILNKIEEVKK